MQCYVHDHCGWESKVTCLSKHLINTSLLILALGNICHTNNVLPIGLVLKTQIIPTQTFFSCIVVQLKIGLNCIVYSELNSVGDGEIMVCRVGGGRRVITLRPTMGVSFCAHIWTSNNTRCLHPRYLYSTFTFTLPYYIPTYTLLVKVKNWNWKRTSPAVSLGQPDIHNDTKLID